MRVLELELELEDLGAEHLVCLELRLQLVQGQHAGHQTRARGNVLLYVKYVWLLAASKSTHPG